jgi:two-component system chemotaxis response regulator CheB
MYGAGHMRVPGVVVLGSSFGGMQALRTVLPALPEWFPIPVIVVHHRSSRASDSLAAILRSRCAMPVDRVEPGYRLTAGRVAVAPPSGFHDLSESGAITIDAPQTADSTPGPVDRTLCAVARRFGRSAIAVIMTGRLADGAQGVRAIKRAGGFVVVQDPASSAADGMPIAALASGCADHRVPLQLIAPTLVAVTMAPGALDLLRVPAAPWATAPVAV